MKFALVDGLETNEPGHFGEMRSFLNATKPKPKTKLINCLAFAVNSIITPPAQMSQKTTLTPMAPYRYHLHVTIPIWLTLRVSL